MEEFFEVLNAEVGYADVADFASGGEFLQFLPVEVVSGWARARLRVGGIKGLPCLDEVPIWQMLRFVIRVGRGRPVLFSSAKSYNVQEVLRTMRYRST